MRWKLLPAMAGLLTMLAAMHAAPADAQTVDYGPPRGPVLIECDSLAVDPPFQVTVTMHFTINGVPYERSIVYGASVPGLAVIDISDLTTGTDTEYVITAYATWNLGTGQTPTFSETLLCNPSPQSPSPSATTPPPSAAPADPPSPSATPPLATSPAGATAIPPVADPSLTPSRTQASTSGATLPVTGHGVTALALFGAALVVSGAVTVAPARRPREL